MSEPWMPSESKIVAAVGNSHHYSWTTGGVRTLIREAVEKAVAPWIQAVGLLSTLAGDVPVDVDDPVAMAQEIEASVRRHRARRELAEAEEAIRFAMPFVPEEIDGYDGLGFIRHPLHDHPAVRRARERKP